MEEFFQFYLANAGGQRKSRRSVSFDIAGQDYQINVNSLRYAVFYESTDCYMCGMQADHFLLQAKSPTETSAHFNLFADGEKAVLFTKDHIMPRAAGGKDELSNLKTCCYTCNQEKADEVK